VEDRIQRFKQFFLLTLIAQSLASSGLQAKTLCQILLKKPSPEIAAGLSFTEAFQLDSYDSMIPGGDFKYRFLNRQISLMTNKQMFRALSFLLMAQNRPWNAYTTPVRRFFRKASTSQIIHILGPNQDELRPEILDFAFVNDLPHSTSGLSIYFQAETHSVYLGPTTFDIEGSEAQPEFWRVSNQRLVRILKSWALRDY